MYICTHVNQNIYSAINLVKSSSTESSRRVMSDSSSNNSIAGDLTKSLMLSLSFIAGSVASTRIYSKAQDPSECEQELQQSGCPVTASYSGGCPFSSSSSSDVVVSTQSSSSKSKNPYEILQDFKDQKARVIMLYEIYVHLPELKAIWDHPITVSPQMEPYFAAACHGLEICFLMLANFISDARIYLVKRPRIEAVCKDIVSQCQLLAELLDGQLEDVVIEQEVSIYIFK